MPCNKAFMFYLFVSRLPRAAGADPMDDDNTDDGDEMITTTTQSVRTRSEDSNSDANIKGTIEG